MSERQLEGSVYLGLIVFLLKGRLLLHDVPDHLCSIYEPRDILMLGSKFSKFESVQRAHMTTNTQFALPNGSCIHEVWSVPRVHAYSNHFVPASWVLVIM